MSFDIQRMPLAELVRLSTERIAGQKDVRLPYVGLEHIAQGEPFLLGVAPGHTSTSTNSVFCRGDILFGKLRPNLRKSLQVDFEGYCSTDILVLRTQDGVDPGFAARVFQGEAVFRRAVQSAIGTKMPRISWADLKALSVFVPLLAQQRRIAEILDTADEAIQQTERVIAKLKAVKAGLLHDLLTRGLDEHGRLRDPVTHPEQFKDSPLGSIPRAWSLNTLRVLAESAVDGPFGSNLKLEHYVTEPGVRVVRLQNIESGRFDDTDKAYISEAHALTLQRHAVVTGDLVVASLGDQNHPFARACLYPAALEPGIVKADCFRLRLRPSLALPAFIMHVLNCPTTRREINTLGHGVTRDRVTLSALLGVRVPVPPIAEQKQSSAILESHDARIHAEEAALSKLRQVKRGLMDELLTGRVRVQT